MLTICNKICYEWNENSPLKSKSDENFPLIAIFKGRNNKREEVVMLTLDNMKWVYVSVFLAVECVSACVCFNPPTN